MPATTTKTDRMNRVAPDNRIPVIDRIERRSVTEDRGYVTPCRIWTGPLNHHGYGRIWRDDRMVPTHRAMWEHHNGPMSPGLETDHLCCQKDCCEITHLEAVTGLENSRRAGVGPALNVAKTHCVNGHEFTPETTYFDRSRTGKLHRHCKTCNQIRSRARYVARTRCD